MNYVANYSQHIKSICFILTLLSISTFANAVVTHSSELVDKAQSTLDAALRKNRRFDSLKLRAITHPNDRNIPLSEFVIVLPKTDIISKRMCVRLKHQKQTIPIWFAVEATQKVLIASHRIKGQSELKPTDYFIEKRNIAGIRSVPLQALPIHRWVIKSINKNQIITEEQLTTVPEIIQGNTIDVRATNHNVVISTKAIAQSNGYVGQLIKVKNAQSNKLFVARIISKNRVEAVL